MGTHLEGSHDGWSASILKWLMIKTDVDDEQREWDRRARIRLDIWFMPIEGIEQKLSLCMKSISVLWRLSVLLDNQNESLLKYTRWNIYKMVDHLILFFTTSPNFFPKNNTVLISSYNTSGWLINKSKSRWASKIVMHSSDENKATTHSSTASA